MGFIDVLDRVGAAIATTLNDLGIAAVENGVAVAGALLVLLVGYVIAWVVGEVIEKGLTKIKFEKWVLGLTGANSYVGGLRLNHLLGVLAKWYVWVPFWAEASGIVSLTGLELFLGTIAIWIPRLIAAILISIIGFIIAEFVAVHVRHTKAKSAHLLSDIFQAIILVFTGLTVLRIVGLDVTLAESTFLIVVGGVVFAFALAFGLGFGLAMKDEAKSTIRKLRKKW